MKIRKYNIEKKQSGGIIYTPFVPSYTDSEAESSSSSSSSSDVGKIGDVQKEIMDVLQENGLPSDVDYFMQTATSFLRRAELTGDWSIADFTRIQSLANRVAHNKTLYDSATQHLTETGNWNEVALNDKGQMYVIDKDSKVITIDPGEYYKNQNQYQALTNNDILEFRSNASPFDTSVLNSLSGSIGLDDIVEYAKGIALDFGTKSISGYTNSDIAKMDEALNRLINNGPKGYYKYKEESQNGGGPTLEALQYLYNSLPNNMKQLLRAKTAAEGQDPNIHYADLLAQILSNHLDYNLSSDYDSTATKDDPKYAAGTTGSGTTKTDTYLEHLTTGSTLGEYRDFKITPTGSSVTLNIKGQNAGPLVDRQGDAVQQNNLKVLLTGAYGFQVTDTNAVTFGSQRIKPQDYDKIVWDGSSQLIRAFLPFTTAEDGKIIPDFELLDLVDQFQKEIDTMGGQITPNIQHQIQQYFQGVVFYNPQTKKLQVNDDYVKPFLVISGYANSNTMPSLNTEDRFLTSVDKQTGSEIKPIYENLTEYYLPNKSKNGKDTFVDQANPRKGRFYKGNIYIPITGRTIGVHLSSGQEIPKSTYMDVNGNNANQDIITTW